MGDVRLTNLNKTYGKHVIIPDLSMTVEDGSFTVLVGPSGCGKSTLLRMVAGLETVTHGTIEIGGKDVTTTEPSDRGIAMVFQSYALYPHMTVRANIGFGLKLAKMPKPDIKARVEEAAEILQLGPLLDRKPKELSGGQRQRVAIGRSIVRKPDVFLFDEPLSNLDAALRSQMRVELAELHEKLGATMIYVTHDQVEAMTMADKIVILKQGEIQQIGNPMDLYNKPDNPFVAQFIGSPKMNMIEGAEASAKGARWIGVRPEHIELSADHGPWKGRLRHVEHLGSDTVAYIDGEDIGSLTVRVPGQISLRTGETIYMTPQAEHTHLFSSDGVAIR